MTMRRADAPPLAARDVDPLERLRAGIIEDLSVVENLEEIGPVLLAALERTEKAKGGEIFGFSQGKSVASVVRCTHDQRSCTNR